MLSRWRIQETPTENDPERRLLLVKGALKDIHSLIRRFGALCGRPKKEQGGGEFNYRLYLHAATAEKMAALESELAAMGGENAAAPTEGIEARSPAEGRAAAPAPPPSPASLEAAAVSDPHAGEQSLFGAVLSAREDWTLDSYSVGGFNRFAHAAAMSVLSSPGTMYNPLYICGPAGSGKSRMLHGIAEKLREQAPDKPVFLTGGARLARAAEAALAAGAMGRLLESAKTSSALLVDDVHLLGVTEANQPALAGFVAAFRTSGKQIVLSSVYSQKLLGGLDEALQFQFQAGHAVEFKAPGPDAKKKILASLLESLGFPSQGSEGFLDAAAGRFENLEICAERLRALKSLREGAGSALALADAQAFLLSARQAADTPAEELKSAAAALGKPSEGERTAALFFPAGQETHARWSWLALHETARNSGWPFPFRAPAFKAYELDPPGAAPFIVAQEIAASRPRATLVLGAPPGSGLFEHEGDFKYALSHLMPEEGCRLGWLNFRQVKDPGAYVEAYLDLLGGTVAPTEGIEARSPAEGRTVAPTEGIEARSPAEGRRGGA